MPPSRNPSARGTRSAVHRSRRSPVHHRPRCRFRRRSHRRRRCRRRRHHRHRHQHPRPPPAPPRRLCPARTPCRPWRPLPLATTLRHPLSPSVPLPPAAGVGALAPDDTVRARPITTRQLRQLLPPQIRPAERSRATSVPCGRGIPLTNRDQTLYTLITRQLIFNSQLSLDHKRSFIA